jgi:hypothetical protein
MLASLQSPGSLSRKEQESRIDGKSSTPSKAKAKKQRQADSKSKEQGRKDK